MVYYCRAHTKQVTLWKRAEVVKQVPPLFYWPNNRSAPLQWGWRSGLGNPGSATVVQIIRILKIVTVRKSCNKCLFLIGYCWPHDKQVQVYLELLDYVIFLSGWYLYGGKHSVCSTTEDLILFVCRTQHYMF